MSKVSLKELRFVRLRFLIASGIAGKPDLNLPADVVMIGLYLSGRTLKRDLVDYNSKRDACFMARPGLR